MTPPAANIRGGPPGARWVSCAAMGKAKKRLTNERRARRLGTGEGIARTDRRQGGVPGWAWLVAGSVVVAAIIVGVALIARGGGGGGSGGDGDQTASAVTSRLTHDK